MNVYLVLSEFISTPVSPLATNELSHGSPNFFWERATPVTVGWFAGNLPLPPYSRASVFADSNYASSAWTRS